MENSKGTIQLDGNEMQMYADACYDMAREMVAQGRKYDVQRWLILWAKMNLAKREFHLLAGRELSEKHLGKEEKPTPEESTFRAHIILGGTDMR
ncbi:hypothetical protein SD71_15950 [Cohnella kolymensis]|uniref:Uncharacterized protein n=1 Tax=Cohnella kolymensis TaxID=1590652 RepID=A0ABR5A239_9BACL|nr:hypothetical protein [Cohnella kolymensis]KIL35128.1 hypothetical protein SD71_15950 [Cohnella kolymensis]